MKDDSQLLSGDATKRAAILSGSLHVGVVVGCVVLAGMKLFSDASKTEEPVFTLVVAPNVSSDPDPNPPSDSNEDVATPQGGDNKPNFDIPKLKRVERFVAPKPEPEPEPVVKPVTKPIDKPIKPTKPTQKTEKYEEWAKRNLTTTKPAQPNNTNSRGTGPSKADKIGPDPKWKSGKGTGNVNGDYRLNQPPPDPNAVVNFWSLFQLRVREAWRIPPDSDRLSVFISMDVSASGLFSNVRVSRSSGSKAFDDSAVAAIMQVRSAGAPPGGKPIVGQVIRLDGVAQ